MERSLEANASPAPGVMPGPAIARCRRRARLAAVLAAAVAWPAIAPHAFAQELGDWSLGKLRDEASGTSRPILSFRLEGKVVAFGKRSGLIALDDGGCTGLLRLPSLPSALRAGDRVAIEGRNCAVGRGAFALRLGTDPVVDVDGHHPATTRFGKVFLKQGMQPLRVEWFNGLAEFALKLEYEVEGLKLRAIRPVELWHRGPGGGDFKPGLEFRSYETPHFHGVSDIRKLKPRSRGIAPDLDLGVRHRRDMVGLVFSGFFKAPRTGVYTFHLSSDDGSRLYAGEPTATCRVIEQTGEAADDPHENTDGRWGSLEGTVAYAAWQDERLELELTRNSDTFQVTIADGSGLEPAALLQKRVAVRGLKRPSGIVAIDSAQLRVMRSPQGRERLLTRAVEIRKLRPDDPVESYDAEIQGVVTMVAPWSMVVQDATGGVFVHRVTDEEGNPPQPGELWKVEGQASQGDFSPVLHLERATRLGNAPLPKAVQPTRQQLASGSLDGERVELEGVVLEVPASELKLLTRGGLVTVVDDSLYPMPRVADGASLVGGVVRLRGVCRAIWDEDTGSVQPSEMMLGNATMSVDQTAGGDPFAGPFIRPSDLLLFTTHPTALKRVKVSGQLLYARPPEYHLFDGAMGFRVVARDSPPLEPGDELVVSGFPQLGGPSPALLESVVRKAGGAPLPTPSRVAADRLPDDHLDSTRVEIVATLLSDTLLLDERVLEMQAGTHRFAAFVPSGKAMPPSIERGSTLNVTGVYISTAADRSPTNSGPFELRIQSGRDIKVVTRGPWWTTRRTFTLIGILSAVLVLVLLWVNVLRRTVARRSSELALEIEEREMIERHRAMEQERSRMAQDLHDELGSGLTEVGFLSSLMKNPAVPEAQKQGYLEQLRGLSFSLVSNLDEIVWAVNPRYDSVADLAGYFSLYAQRFLKLAGVACRLEIDDAITTDHLDSRTRHGVFLVFKEALNNVAKHSGASEVVLTIRVVASNLVVSIADNGCGFDPATDLPGSDGLRNMEQRIKGCGGKIVIETNPGKGTRAQLIISLKTKHP